MSYYHNFVIFVIFSMVNLSLCNHKHLENENLEEAREKFLNYKNYRTVQDILNEQALTFMVTAKDLGGVDKNEVNSKLSLFYSTAHSDFNSQTTDIVKNSKNPEWNMVFKFFWKKGTNQVWQFKVKNMLNGNSEALIGEAKVDVDKFVENGQSLVLPLENGQGSLVLEKTTPLLFKLTAQNLARKDTWGGLSDPYVIFYWRRGPDGPDVQFGKTDVINNVVDAEWMGEHTFEAYQPQKDMYLHMKVYDDDGFTSDDFLGEAFLKMDETLQANLPLRRTINLVNEPQKKTGRGTLTIIFQKI